MSKPLRLLLATALAAAIPAAAQPARAAPGPQRLAVLEFELAPGLKIDRTYFSDLARGAVHRRVPALFVMTRESVEALLAADGRTLGDCQGACEVEVGRKLGADFIISGRIAQIGSWLTLTLRLFSTADGRLLETTEGRGKGEDELLERADAAVAALVAPLAAAGAAPPLAAAAPGPAPSIVAQRAAETAAVAPAARAPSLPPEVLEPAPAEPARPGRTLAWAALGAGVLIGAGSTVFDNKSSTSHDGKLTAIDFLPVAGYAVALALGGWGIVQLVKP